MSRNWFAARFDEIRSQEEMEFVSRVTGDLSRAFSFRTITAEQQWAWKVAATQVHEWVTEGSSLPGEWLALFEYAPPLITARPDLVIVCGETVLAIEAKTGQQVDRTSARAQALRYAADLYWFHEGTRGRRVVPILWLPRAVDKPRRGSLPNLDEPPTESHVMEVTAEELAEFLDERSRVRAERGATVREDLWRQANYRPRPSIVDAAVGLFAGVDDEGLQSTIYDDHEIEQITSFLIREVTQAAATGGHHLLLVTGVPGAGKTLVGLRLAHDRTIVKRLTDAGEAAPLFLTGNGPLVKVLTEALARDYKSRTGCTKDEADRHAGTLVKLVHAFTRDGLTGESIQDVPQVAVFDEGQRVWDADQMEKKHAIPEDSGPTTEPEVILRRLEKRPWAVVVVLIGEGQEINTGELGAALWPWAAISRRRAGVDWKVSAPPGLAATADGELELQVVSSLHLGVSRRADRADWLSGWVEHVLSGDDQTARTMLEEHNQRKPGEYPILVTRELSEARRWLRMHQRGARIGLVASAHAARLRPYGIEMDREFHAGIDWPRWFLNRPPKLDSSGALEVAASEFACQGLELDFVGVCWSWDLIRSGKTWQVRHLPLGHTQWVPKGDPKRTFGINAYRVLLTRARAGMVIWVPRGAADDPSRSPQEMEEVAQFLVACGAAALPTSAG